MSTIPSTMPALKRQRADAALRAHHALVAFMFGVQIFLYGTGRAPQTAGNAMYLCALSAPLCAMLLVLPLRALRRRHDMQPLPAVYRAVWGRIGGGAACLVTGTLFLVDVMGALAMLAALGSARLLPVESGSATYLPALLALFVAVTFSGSGLERLAFLSRRVTPIVLLVLSFVLVRHDPLSNLLPLLGRNLPDTARSAAYTTGAAACTLALGFSPAALPDEAAAPCRTGLRALWLSGGCAAALLLSVALSTPPTALPLSAQWPEVLVHTGAYTENTGVFYLPVVLLECYALLLAMGGALRFASESFAGVMPRPAARAVVFVLTICAAATVFLAGNAPVFALLPWRSVPALVLVLSTLAVDRLRARRTGRRNAA